MSIENNIKLLEEASDLIDVWSGTIAGKMLEWAVETNDLERVQELVTELRSYEHVKMEGVF